jgi:hypothetical protein
MRRFDYGASSKPRGRKVRVENLTGGRIGMAETETRTHITQVGTVMVPVSDQDRALAFYVETLGFEKRGDIPYGDGDRWLEWRRRAPRRGSPWFVPDRPGSLSCEGGTCIA